MLMTNFSESLPKLLVPNKKEYPLPNNPYFKLSLLKQSDSLIQKRSSVELIFCLKGEASIQVNDQVLKITTGEAILIGSGTSKYQLNAKNGLTYKASSTI